MDGNRERARLERVAENVRRFRAATPASGVGLVALSLLVEPEQARCETATDPRGGKPCVRQESCRR